MVNVEYHLISQDFCENVPLYQRSKSHGSAFCLSSFIFVILFIKKMGKTEYISTMMWGEAGEGAGNCSVPSFEKAKARLPLPWSAKCVAALG